MSETVTKTNMCIKGYKEPISMCSAKEIASQENCTHYWPATRAKRCIFYRDDILGACDNSWAQRKVEMPEYALKLLKSSST